MYVDGRTIVEHQFMNVGPGAHVATTLDFFARHGFSVVVSCRCSAVAS
jgi:hypothetical protein